MNGDALFPVLLGIFAYTAWSCVRLGRIMRLLERRFPDCADKERP